MTDEALRAYLHHLPDAIGAQCAEALRTAQERFKTGPEDRVEWKFGGVDGWIQLHTDGDPSDRDTVRMSGEEFRNVIALAHANGARIALHAAVDAANEVEAAPPAKDLPRHTLDAHFCERCAETKGRAPERGCSLAPEFANGACDQ